MEVITNSFKFIGDLKVVYKGIKEIRWSEELTKGKETTTLWIQKYFEILKEKPSRTTKALNIPSISRKPLGKNLIEFSPELSLLVSPILSTAPIKKLNLTTLETTLESFLSSPRSSTFTTSSSNSTNIMVARGKMIVYSQKFYGRPKGDSKA